MPTYSTSSHSESDEKDIILLVDFFGLQFSSVPANPLFRLPINCFHDPSAGPKPERKWLLRTTRILCGENTFPTVATGNGWIPVDEENFRQKDGQQGGFESGLEVYQRQAVQKFDLSERMKAMSTLQMPVVVEVAWHKDTRPQIVHFDLNSVRQANTARPGVFIQWLVKKGPTLMNLIQWEVSLERVPTKSDKSGKQIVAWFVKNALLSLGADERMLIVGAMGELSFNNDDGFKELERQADMAIRVSFGAPITIFVVQNPHVVEGRK